ncbi:MAG: MdtA/MuxA family multidrug efflux RND transporter periplasmic adaptor subunit [Planctomycetaceae bacterium]|nr:MdtA/MuxA family multidrug efflux RND transporter periplasmic adaptor subunit [Planctomycetaceae bacterium]
MITTPAERAREAATPLSNKTAPAPSDVPPREPAPTEAGAAPRENRTTPRDGTRGTTLPPPAARSNWKGWIVFAVLVAGAWFSRPYWWPHIQPFFNRGAGGPAKPAARPIPVKVAKAEQRDLPIYLNALGTVTAYKTVVLRSRVDGELMKFAFEEGQVVKEGDFLAQIDPRPFEAAVEQAEGQLARDQATLSLAKLTLTRNQDLLRRKSISQQEVDIQAALVQQTEGTIKIDQAAVDTARLQLSYCRIVAPVSGRIGLRAVDQGNIVRANDLNGMATITQLDPISLVFTIPQDDIPRILKPLQEEKTLKVDAFDRDFKKRIAEGHLDAIDNQVDPQTGTLRLKAVFDNKEHLLFPNQFVNVRLLVETKKDAILVPSAAVQRGPNSTFVYVVKSDDTVELRNVIIGPTEGTETALETGLTVGETVVTDGIDKLRAGAKVSLPGKDDEGGEKRGKGKGKKDVEAKPAGEKKS